MPKRRLILFDAGLQSKHGHHLNVDLGITHEAEKRGLEWIVYGNLSCADPEIRELLRPRPLFKANIYGTLPSSQDPVYNCAASNEAYVESLRSLDLSSIGSNDVLFFHTIHSPNILGLTSWLEWITPTIRPLIVIYVLYPDYIDMWTGRKNNRAAIFEGGLSRLSKIPSLRLRILAETPSIKSDLEGMSARNLNIELGPFPGDYQNIVEAGLADWSLPHSEANEVQIGYFGRTRIRKGVLLLPRIISLSVSLRKNLRFVVQIDADGDYRATLNDAIAELYDNPGITHIDGAMSTKDYFRQLKGCDIVLLPYSKGYNRQGSGILSEAVALGKILVAPEYANFQEQLLPYGAACVYFSEWNASSVAAALVEAVDRKGELKDRALAAAPIYLRERGPNVFFDELFGSIVQGA